MIFNNLLELLLDLFLWHSHGVNVDWNVDNGVRGALVVNSGFVGWCVEAVEHRGGQGEDEEVRVKDALKESKMSIISFELSNHWFNLCLNIIDLLAKFLSP